MKSILVLSLKANPTMTTPPSPIFEEENGLVVIEAEAHPIVEEAFSKPASYRGVWNEWVAETHKAGFTGDCYYRWGGPVLKGNPGSGILTYRFRIKQAGSYRLVLRSFSEASGVDNAVFTRLDGGQWLKGKSKVHGEWTWSWMYEFHHDDANPSREPCWHELAEGVHTLEVSGRCTNFCFDRLVWAVANVNFENPRLPQSAVQPALQT
jgi:hypothetical protein